MKANTASLMVGILLATLACGLISPTTAPDQPGVETIVAATIQAFTTSVPPTEVLQPSGIPVSFQNISLVIPDGTATGADAAAVPAQTGDDAPPWDIAPQHVVFSFDGWLKPDTNNLIPTIMVFPAQEYAAANPGAANNLPLLQALLADPAAPINMDTAPQVPYFNAAQSIVAKPARLSFGSGSGIRMLNFYAQFPGPIIDQGQVYHYQGLTSDGRYYIIAVLPLASPLLSTADNPSADGIAYPDPGSSDGAAMNAYYQAMTDKLNAASPDAFTPTLDQLDALIQSISVTSD